MSMAVVVGLIVAFVVFVSVVAILVAVALAARKRTKVQRRAAWGVGGAAPAAGFHGATHTGCSGSTYWANQDFGTSAPGPHYGSFHGGHSSHDHHGSGCSGSSCSAGGCSSGCGGGCGGGGGGD